MRVRITVMIGVLLLAGCGESSRIQDDYVAQRDSCQSLAEQQIVKYQVPGKVVSPQARNAELVTLFSDCMAKNGWQVATPKREDAPGGSPAIAPAAAPVPVAPVPAPVAPAPVVTPVPAAPVSAPVPVAPVPAPVAPAPVVTPAPVAAPVGAATYQPAMPVAPVAAPR